MHGQYAEVIIWRDTDDLQIQTMYCLYSRGLISEITTQKNAQTISRHVERWQFEERVSFALYTGHEVTFKAIDAEYRARQQCTFRRG